MIWSRIVGTGGYLPERVVTNHELSRHPDTNDAWIRERTGIASRHIAAAGEKTSDLALIASRRALQAAGVAPTEVDLVIVATGSSQARLVCFRQSWVCVGARRSTFRLPVAGSCMPWQPETVSFEPDRPARSS
jgi:hypothetical protein